MVERWAVEGKHLIKIMLWESVLFQKWLVFEKKKSIYHDDTQYSWNYFDIATHKLLAWYI